MEQIKAGAPKRRSLQGAAAQKHHFRAWFKRAAPFFGLPEFDCLRLATWVRLPEFAVRESGWPEQSAERAAGIKQVYGAGEYEKEKPGTGAECQHQQHDQRPARVGLAA